MMVCVIGAKGNMGRRYVSILDNIKVDLIEADIGDDLTTDNLKGVTHFIIATPTDTHLLILDKLTKIVKNSEILCEKPFFTADTEDDIWNAVEITMKILREHAKNKNNVYMVNNYLYMAERSRILGIEWQTSYDFYHSGSDGIEWDCIQLIHLAKDRIYLGNDSPVWNVQINGKLLSKNDVDCSYLDMIKEFLGFPKIKKLGNLWGAPDIISSHLKMIKIKELMKEQLA